MNFIKKNVLSIVGIALGAIAGYAYYYYVGCTSGTCMITSKPFNSSLYGAVMGGLLLNMFQTEKSKSN